MDRNKFFDTVNAIPSYLRCGVSKTLKEYGIEHDGTIYLLYKGRRSTIGSLAVKKGYTVTNYQDTIENIDESVILELIEVATSITKSMIGFRKMEISNDLLAIGNSPESGARMFEKGRHLGKVSRL